MSVDKSQYVVSDVTKKQHSGVVARRNQLITMKSRGIHSSHDEGRERQRVNKNPDNNPKTIKQRKPAGFIQAPAFIVTTEIRRASEQTSPQMARAAGHSRQSGTKTPG
ncbi:hypothetical protein [Puniceibacterium confluentis]|uniref:hypothetical protein n=1 Tax=Puniceibacterium confluentis TaxID=1958944 RepID=UPI0011B43644|nr:hypothetical protein [Puniceibacterium confluentis]